jgi:hypothetical protein
MAFMDYIWRCTPATDCPLLCTYGAQVGKNVFATIFDT